MSVKFERETIQNAPPPPGNQQTGGFLQQMTQQTTQTKNVSEGQGKNAAAESKAKPGYLAAYIEQLEQNPLRTRMLTSGSLAALQELLASWIAKDTGKHGHYFSSRIPKMAVYGAFISAPLGHFLIKILQKMFSGRKSLRAKIFQIIVSNLIVSPIQNTVYLAAMAVIAGARTFHQIRATIRAGFMPVMKVSWITSPFALAFAQKFLPEHMWVTFFNLISFVIGTYVNAHTKKKRLAALRKKYYDDRRGTNDYPRPDYRD